MDCEADRPREPKDGVYDRTSEQADNIRELGISRRSEVFVIIVHY